MKPQDQLINWRALSRLLTGGSESVRSYKVPKVHEQKVNRLRELIREWINADI